MNNTLRHIEFLVTRHECVVVPGFGALLSRYEGAGFDVLTGQLVAPSRRLVFNTSIAENDGLIANSIARANGVSYEKAVKVMDEELRAMKLRFEADGELALGRLGRLVKDANGGVIFEASPKYSRNSAYSWLANVKPVDVAENARLNSEHAEDEDERSSRFAGVMAFVRAACILIVFVCLGLAVSTPVKVDNAQYASLAPSIKMSRPIAQGESFTMIVDRKLNDSDIVDTASRFAWQRSCRTVAQNYNTPHIEDVQADSPLTASTAADKSADVPRFVDSDPYLVVVASLTSRQDAEKFIEHEHLNKNTVPMGVIDNDGRYRVYAATGTTLAEAQRGVNAMTRRFKGAWICKK